MLQGMGEDLGALCDLSDTTHEVLGPYSNWDLFSKPALRWYPSIQHLELQRLGFVSNKLSDDAPMETEAVNV